MKHDLKGDLRALMWWAGCTGVGFGMVGAGVDTGDAFTWASGLFVAATFLFITIKMYGKIQERNYGRA